MTGRNLRLTAPMLISSVGLNNFTKVPIPFKTKLQTQFGAYAVLNLTVSFLSNLGFVCLSLTTQKANACSA